MCGMHQHHPPCLTQVEAYCGNRRTRYFAISTYEVTWVGCVRGERMLVSRGFAWNDAHVTVLKVTTGRFSGTDGGRVISLAARAARRSVLHPKTVSLV